MVYLLGNRRYSDKEEGILVQKAGNVGRGDIRTERL